MIVLITASFTYVVAQIVGVGIITARFLDIDFQVACFVGLLGILVCSMLGGMKAVTWTQVAQYIILIIAYLMPVVVLSAQGHRRADPGADVRPGAARRSRPWSRRSASSQSHVGTLRECEGRV